MSKKSCGICRKSVQLIDKLKQNKYYLKMLQLIFFGMAMFTLLIPDILLRDFVQPKIYAAEGVTMLFLPSQFFQLWHVSLLTEVLPFVFSALWAAIFVILTTTILPKRWGRFLYAVIGVVFYFYAFCQYVFSGIFDGQFFRLESLGLAGEGADYLSYALSYIDISLIAYTILEIVCLIVVCKFWKTPEFTTKRKRVFAKLSILAPIVILTAIHFSMNPTEEDRTAWDAWKRPTVIYADLTDANKGLDITGVYHFAIRDAYKTLTTNSSDAFTEEDYAFADNYFEQKKAEYQPNEYTGMYEGKNVIAIMLEGIDDWLISDKYTPVIKYMMNNGICFSDYYAPQYGSGLTLGSEFCFHTGFYTPISGVSPINYASNYYPYAIPSLFAKKGYSVNSFHYNHAEFYNRGIMHASMGYEKYHSFIDDYGIPENEAVSDSNILKNQRIFDDIVKDEPFFSFVITYSGHVPYDFDDAKLERVKQNHPELIDPNMDTETNNCHLLARDTDDFFRMLLQKLHESGKLNDTVIVVFTDHDAYGFSDHEKLLQYSIEAGNSNVHRVPAFIYNATTTPMNITKPCQTADWAPTLINLFNLENSHCYIGNDILSPRNEGFVHFANYSWIESNLIFMPGITEYESNDVVNGQIRTQEAIRINDIVVAGNYFDKRR